MLSLEHTINSGQVFLWQKRDSRWYGINGQDVICVQQGPYHIESYSGTGWDLFRDSDDFARVRRQISKDPVIREAAKRFPGLRLMRQDPFQCYISFIVSANSNIQNIRGSLYKIVQRFGRKVTYQNMQFHLFPEASRLARASMAELASCGLGYRARYVKSAAIAARDGTVDFDILKKADYHTAKQTLCKVDGIGSKVADCIMLFSLEKTDSFPLDRWMLRVLEQYYPGRFPLGGKTLTEKRYATLHDELRSHFGPYSGYCQQFLFKMIRETNSKKW